MSEQQRFNFQTAQSVLMQQRGVVRVRRTSWPASRFAVAAITDDDAPLSTPAFLIREGDGEAHAWAPSIGDWLAQDFVAEAVPAE